MNYIKIIYRRPDIVSYNAIKMLEDGKELVPGFREKYECFKKLKAESMNISGNHKSMGLSWDEAVKKSCSLGEEAERILHEAARSYLGPQFVNVHILVGYCPQTIPYYKKMIDELKKTFPQADEEEIELSKVEKSSWAKGFTIITWKGKASFKDKETLNAKDSNWIVKEEFEYCW